MSEKTPMEKLIGIKMRLLAIKSHIPEIYQDNVNLCVQWCRDLEEHLTIIDKDEDEEET